MGRRIDYLNKPIPAASLAAFRIFFGLMMFVSVVRFMTYGWVHQFYIKPNFFFTYFGFEWIRPLPEWGMYLVFILLAILALMIAAGLFYRLSILLFFLCFTYVELIDKATYLNHYYFISILSFLMIFFH